MADLSQYDDIPASPLLNTAMLETPPSPYKGLCYSNVGLGNYSLNAVGFMPHSETNALYNAPEEGRAQGKLATISTNQCDAGSPAMFTAYSIYVACTAADGQGDVATVPVSCPMLFNGTQNNGKTVSL